MHNIILNKDEYLKSIFLLIIFSHLCYIQYNETDRTYISGRYDKKLHKGGSS